MFRSPGAAGDRDDTTPGRPRAPFARLKASAVSGDGGAGRVPYRQIMEHHNGNALVIYTDGSSLSKPRQSVMHSDLCSSTTLARR